MGHNKIHSTEHTDGTDDIQDATASQKGLASAAQIAKLNGIASQAGEPVLGRQNTPPVTPTTGDRYIVGTSPTGAWVGQADKIAEWDGATWVFTTPANGTVLAVAGTYGEVWQYYYELSPPSEGRTVGWELWLNQALSMAETPQFQSVILNAAQNTRDHHAVRLGTLRSHTFQDAIINTGTVAPVSPTFGDRHLVATGGVGDWAGQDGNIAIWEESPGPPQADAWEFYAPVAGWVVYDLATNTELRYNGSAWVSTTQNTYQELHVVTAGEVTAGSFTLTNNPATALGVRVEALDGVAQLHKQTLGIGAEVPDFDVLNTNEVHINNNGAATGLSGSIIEADKLLITYTGA